MKHVKQNFSNIIVCIFEAVIGILLLVNPVGFTSGILVLFGAALMVAGFLSIIRYFRTPAAAAAVGQLLVKGWFCWWPAASAHSTTDGFWSPSRCCRWFTVWESFWPV